MKNTTNGKIESTEMQNPFTMILSFIGISLLVIGLYGFWSIIPENEIKINTKTFSKTLKNYHENSYYRIGIETDKDTELSRVKETYEQLSTDTSFSSRTNPYNKKQIGIGFVEGSKYDNTNKAVYIFTETPNKEEIPYGILYAAIKGNDIEIGMGVKPKENVNEDIEININTEEVEVVK